MFDSKKHMSYTVISIIAIAFIFAATICIAQSDDVAADITDSGTTGDLTWTLEDGVLTISGEGDMPAYTANAQPWRSHRTWIETVVIGTGVTSIGDYAFSSCTSLEEITIPNDVTSIGKNVFSGCTSLKEITIPDRVTSLGAYVFLGCTSLKEITIPDRVTSLGSYAFSNCTSLTSVTIPDGVTSMHSTFSGCTSLTSVTIPDRMTSLGAYVFSNCTSLTSVTIPDGVTSLGAYVFSGCVSLKEITIPDNVTSIGTYAFSGCASLTTATIPNSTTSIGDYAFSGCTSLTSITIPDGVKISNAFPGINIQKVVITTPNAPTGIVYTYFTSDVWGFPYSNFQQPITTLAIDTEYAVDLSNVNTADGHEISILEASTKTIGGTFLSIDGFELLGEDRAGKHYIANDGVWIQSVTPIDPIGPGEPEDPIVPDETDDTVMDDASLLNLLPIWAYIVMIIVVITVILGVIFHRE